MPRSEHSRITAWLENFAVPRRDTARLLVDSLELVSETDLRRELGAAMLGLLPQLAGPVAAFPAREVPPGEYRRMPRAAKAAISFSSPASPAAKRSLAIY